MLDLSPDAVVGKPYRLVEGAGPIRLSDLDPAYQKALLAAQQMADALRQARDLTDAAKTPNFTVREVLMLRTICDKALAETQEATEGSP